MHHTTLTRRIYLLFITIVMLLTVSLPCTALAVDKATLSEGVQNIVARAYQQVEMIWIPLADLKGWRSQSTFHAGQEYMGVPYGQPYEKGRYIASSISFEDFLIAVNTPNNILYRRRGDGKADCPYYSSDCSAFVSYCYGIKRTNTAGLTDKKLFTKISSLDNIEIGDCIVRSGKHVVLLTDMIEQDGVTLYEICEQTPPHAIRHLMTAEEIQTTYLDEKFTIRRYARRDNVKPPVEINGVVYQRPVITANAAQPGQLTLTCPGVDNAVSYLLSIYEDENATVCPVQAYALPADLTEGGAVLALSDLGITHSGIYYLSVAAASALEGNLISSELMPVQLVLLSANDFETAGAAPTID